MKRLLTVALAIAALAAFGAASYTQEGETLTIGIVTYQFDAHPTADATRLEGILVRELELLPPPEGSNSGTGVGTAGTGPRTKIKFVFDIQIADTAEAQSAAIASFVEQGVAGIILVPVPDVEGVRAAVNRALVARMPVVVAFRPIPGLHGSLQSYMGAEYFAVGVGWSIGSEPDPTFRYAPQNFSDFFVVASDLSDPIQQALSEGLASSKAYQETLVLDESAVFDTVVAKLTADADIRAVIVSDPFLVPEVIRGVKEVTAGGERLVKVGCLGTPPGATGYFNDRTLHVVVTPEIHYVYREAALQLKLFNVSAEPLQTVYVPVQLFSGGLNRNYMNYPYDYLDQRTFTFDRFWR